MALRVDHCTDEDMRRVFELVSISFGHEHPFIEAVYPAHDSPAGRADGAERLLAVKKTDPHSRFLKVTDTSTGKIIGASKWNVYDKVIPEEATKLEGDYWETDEAKELAEWNLNEYLKLRRKAIRDSRGNLVSLDLMCVDPEHQYRGAGTLLMEWGTGVADDLGVEAVVEASVYGRQLYEKFGFIMEQHVTMEPPLRWATSDPRQKQRFFWMRRPIMSGSGK